jgi:predicted HD superfamily hydrolase involved in NAD metabolism
MATQADSRQSQYTTDLEARVEAWARQLIAPHRVGHVEGVVQTAGALARQYAPESVIPARIGGWIHDAAKHWKDDALLAYAEENGLPISDAERATPMLLHGIVGYALANEVFGFDDPALRDACAYHTTGAPGMGVLAKIVYLADMIEPGRDCPGVDVLRAEAMRDLDAAVLRAADDTLRYLIDKQRPADPRALQLRNELLLQGVRYEKSNE